MRKGGERVEHRITDIHCPQCGAPADFDIVRQMYRYSLPAVRGAGRF